MPSFWMVRAEGGALISDFERAGCIAIGWTEAGDLSPLRTADDVRTVLRQAYPDTSPGRLTVWTSVLYKFRQAIRPGDRVVSYDPERREYLLGTVTGEYEFNPTLIPDYANIRRVEWQGRVSRDQLSPSTKNTLGSTLTIFEPRMSGSS